jgi:hypothetical protein
MPDLAATNGNIIEKVEGLTVLADGNLLVETDNDGVNNTNGETQLINLGNIAFPFLNYLRGQNDWKWVMAIIRQSGLGKREVLEILLPMKGQGWRFRSEALFTWLEH